MLSAVTAKRLFTPIIRNPHARLMSSSVLTHLHPAIERLTPLALADSSWDNVGIMIEAPFPRFELNSKEKQRVVCCIDLTTAVTTSALSDPSTSLILTYHPPIFRGLKSLSLSNSLEKNLLQCAAKGVSVFTIHTAADNAWRGTNDWLVEGFREGGGGVEVKESRAIKEFEGEKVPRGQGGAGSGRIIRIGDAKGEGVSREKVVELMKKHVGRDTLQAAWSPTGPTKIQTIAICAGSGSSVLKNVAADLHLTGEMSHHDTLSTISQGTHVLLLTHSGSERPWLSSFAPRLEEALNEESRGEVKYEVVVSEADREPLETV